MRFNPLMRFSFSQVLIVLWMLGLVVHILMYGPLDFVVYFPAPSTFQEIW